MLLFNLSLFLFAFASSPFSIPTKVRFKELLLSWVRTTTWLRSVGSMSFNWVELLEWNDDDEDEDEDEHWEKTALTNVVLMSIGACSRGMLATSALACFLFVLLITSAALFDPSFSTMLFELLFVLVLLLLPCWLSVWRLKSTLRWKARPHLSQANGLKPVCFRLCVIRFDDWLNDLPHIIHLCGFSPF